MEKRTRKRILIGSSILIVVIVAVCVVAAVRQANASRIDTLIHDESVKVFLYGSDIETAMTDEERKMLFDLLEKVEYRSPTRYETEPMSGSLTLRLVGVTDNGVTSIRIVATGINDTKVFIEEEGRFETEATLPVEYYQAFLDFYHSIYEHSAIQ
ncbi:MAG: hypothetical protein LBU48_06205 [Coriobacteriales bacterium]|jgi:hypothetical protein|nr:hypothetical protein [Coriobacteriales bacterium]